MGPPINQENLLKEGKKNFDSNQESRQNYAYTWKAQTVWVKRTLLQICLFLFLNAVQSSGHHSVPNVPAIPNENFEMKIKGLILSTIYFSK